MHPAAPSSIPLLASRSVPPTLHTPLMSGANAISGITIVGAVTCAYGSDWSLVANILGALAVALAMTNIVGGYGVTHRMLTMFRTGERSGEAEKTRPESSPAQGATQPPAS